MNFQDDSLFCFRLANNSYRTTKFKTCRKDRTNMAETITFDDFKKLELRTAKVLEARPHPNADKLLLLKVDAGGEPKQIVAGIRLHYAPEDLVGKTVVIVNNLQPAMIRGEESNGMILAASHEDKVVVLRPDADLPGGCGIK